MSVQLRVILIVTVVIYFLIILLLLKHKALQLKYTLLWLIAGLIMGLMVLFPNLLVVCVHLLGIESNMNGLFIMAIGFVIMLLMALTSIVSKQSAKIRILVQEIAQLEKLIRELKNDKEKQNDE